MGRRVLYAFSGAVIAFLLLPSLMIVPMSLSAERHLEFPPTSLSLRHYEAYLSDPEWINPTLFSLRVAALTALLATAIGTMAALALVRGQVPGRGILNTLIVSPMIAPAIITAIAMYLFFIRIDLVGNTLGFVLAHTVLAAPYVVLTVSAALTRFDPSLEMAALSLGASRLTAILRITLPLVMPGVLSGAAFAFIISFDEAVVSFFISDVSGKTLPKKLFEDIDFAVSPIVAAVSTLITVVSIVVVGGIELVRMRAMARIGRAHAVVGED